MKQKVIDILNEQSSEIIQSEFTQRGVIEENFELVAEEIEKLITIPDVSRRTFKPNDTEVEDIAEQIDQFINQHALAKPGTYSRKLREFLASKLTEYGGG